MLKITSIQKLVVMQCNMCIISESDFHILFLFSIFFFFFFFLNQRNSITIKSMTLHVEMYHNVLGNRGIMLTLVVHALLIVISPCNVL